MTTSKSETVDRKPASAEAVAPERKKAAVHPSLRALPDYPAR